MSKNKPIELTQAQIYNKLYNLAIELQDLYVIITTGQPMSGYSMEDITGRYKCLIKYRTMLHKQLTELQKEEV